MLLLLACAESPSRGGDSALLDLSERLGADVARAGRVTDTDELFGGISSEGRPGDWKIYNDRVRFVIQDVGDSGYYVEQGGTLVDADIVRPDGELGRDMLDEFIFMAGLARITRATSVELLDDGSDGEAASVRVEGTGTPLTLATGALENPGLVEDLAVRIRTDYTLAPGSWAMRVETTVWNDEDDAITFQPGAGAIVAREVGTTWAPGLGRQPETNDPIDMSAIVGDRNEGVLALVGDGAPLQTGSIGQILGSLAPMITGFGDTVTVQPGESTTWSTWVAAGPDVATIDAERLARAGAQTIDVAGTVTAGGEPVPGARVHVLGSDGAPISMAVADADGRWSATVDATEDVSFVASGRGKAVFVDLPEGHGWYAPYEADKTATLASFAAGADTEPFAEGYGVSAATTATDLSLTPPGTLSVRVADGGPALVRLFFVDADVTADERLVPGRPRGYAAIGLVRDGAIEMPVEPGTYDVVVRRGVRDTLAVQRVTIASGGRADVLADVHAAYTLDGVVTIDPHSHASPSGDGQSTMEERLLATAANGIDVHVGTDHDHVADYNPLLHVIGLEDRLKSIVADEVSPVLRGHFNAYPAHQGAAANGGAPRWWKGYRDTQEIFGWMREMVGPDGIVQANHPVGDSGMFSFASYDPAGGTIDSPDHWSDDFDAVEVLNAADYADYLPYFLDLAARGKDVVPVGVSDSHSPTDGHLGASITFLDAGTDVAGFGPDVLTAAMHAGGTVVSRGPFVDARMGGERVPGKTVGPGALDVTVYAPDWMPVETVSLYEDGDVVASEPCTGAAPTPCVARFDLAPAEDHSYVVIAESTTQAMGYGYPGMYAWAMTNAVRVDATGDGWTAPKAPLIK